MASLKYANKVEVSGISRKHSPGAVPRPFLGIQTNRCGKLLITHGSPYSSPITTERAAQTAADGLLHVSPRQGSRLIIRNQEPLSAADYHAAECMFLDLLNTPDLDLKVQDVLAEDEVVRKAQLLDMAVAAALDTAYGARYAELALNLLPTSSTNSALGLIMTAVASEKNTWKQAAATSSAGSMDCLTALNSMNGSSSDEDETIAHAAAQQFSKEAAAGGGGGSVYNDLNEQDAGHLFLQRILYRINRLNLFWFPTNLQQEYCNERSVHLARLRNAIEAAWQPWEAQQMGHDVIQGIKQMSPSQLKAALTSRYESDVCPALSEVGRYITQEMGQDGYRMLLAIASIDGLTEASRQSRVCGGAANSVSCMVFKVLMEEYGAGRLAKKHSTFFASMMRELGLNDTPEFYMDLVPWQVMAGANHNFLLTERRRHYLRYAGGLTYFEIVGPSVYRTYLSAAQRLGLSEDASGYWALHIKEDERHGKWMVEDVALPLVDMYQSDGWEVLLGYDQEVFLGRRAAQVVLDRIRTADAQGFKAATAGVPPDVEGLVDAIQHAANA